MRKKNLKEHTTRVHDKNVHPEERHGTFGQHKLSFGKKPAEVDDNEQNENHLKKICLEVDLNNSTDLYTDEVKLKVNLKVNLNLNMKDLKWHLLSGLF